MNKADMSYSLISFEKIKKKNSEHRFHSSRVNLSSSTLYVKSQSSFFSFQNKEHK